MQGKRDPAWWGKSYRGEIENTGLSRGARLLLADIRVNCNKQMECEYSDASLGRNIGYKLRMVQYLMAELVAKRIISRSGRRGCRCKTRVLATWIRKEQPTQQGAYPPVKNELEPTQQVAYKVDKKKKKTEKKSALSTPRWGEGALAMLKARVRPPDAMRIRDVLKGLGQAVPGLRTETGGEKVKAMWLVTEAVR